MGLGSISQYGFAIRDEDMSFEAAWSNGMQFPEKEAYSIRKLEALYLIVDA